MPNLNPTDVALTGRAILEDLATGGADLASHDVSLWRWAQGLRGMAVVGDRLVRRDGPSFAAPPVAASSADQALTLLDQFLPDHDFGLRLHPGGTSSGLVRPTCDADGVDEVHAACARPSLTLSTLTVAAIIRAMDPERGRAHRPQSIQGPSRSWPIRTRPASERPDDLYGADLEQELCSMRAGHRAADIWLRRLERQLLRAGHGDIWPALTEGGSTVPPCTTSFDEALGMATRLFPDCEIGVTRRGRASHERVLCRMMRPEADPRTWVAGRGADAALAMSALVVRGIRSTLRLAGRLDAEVA